MSCYVTALPSGLHLLGAPRDATVMAELGPDGYGELLALLCTFYELVAARPGHRRGGRLAQFAIARSTRSCSSPPPSGGEQLGVSGARTPRTRAHHRRRHNSTRADPPTCGAERRLRERRLHRSVAIPQDEQLAAMLDSRHVVLDGSKNQPLGISGSASPLPNTLDARPTTSARRRGRRHLAMAIAALLAAMLIGWALASNRPEPPADLSPRLERSEQLARPPGQPPSKPEGRGRGATRRTVDGDAASQDPGASQQRPAARAASGAPRAEPNGGRMSVGPLRTA